MFYHQSSEQVYLNFIHMFIRWLEPQVEGKISIKLDNWKDRENWQLSVGCNLPGKWVLHWGVNYINDIGRFALLVWWMFFVHSFSFGFDAGNKLALTNTWRHKNKLVWIYFLWFGVHGCIYFLPYCEKYQNLW